LCMLSGNFLRAAQPVCFLLGLERFSYGRGRSRPLFWCLAASMSTSCHRLQQWGRSLHDESPCMPCRS